MTTNQLPLWAFVLQFPTFKNVIPNEWIMDPNYYVRYQIRKDMSIAKMEIGYLEDEWQLKVGA